MLRAGASRLGAAAAGAFRTLVEIYTLEPLAQPEPEPEPPTGVLGQAEARGRLEDLTYAAYEAEHPPCGES